MDTLKIKPKTLKIRQFYILAGIKSKCLHFVGIVQAINLVESLCNQPFIEALIPASFSCSSIRPAF